MTTRPFLLVCERRHFMDVKLYPRFRSLSPCVRLSLICFATTPFLDLCTLARSSVVTTMIGRLLPLPSPLLLSTPVG